MAWSGHIGLAVTSRVDGDIWTFRMVQENLLPGHSISQYPCFSPTAQINFGGASGAVPVLFQRMNDANANDGTK